MATNNKAVITFNRDFILNDKLEILVSSGGLGSLYTFNWVASPSVAFEVEVGTPTGTTGETAAINFKTAWENSVTGFTVTQSTNEVTIVGQDFSFVSIVAKDGSGNSYLIPTDYNVAISTETTGNKITYSDKVGLIPKGTHINQVWDDDMNEIKTKFNLNDDRIGTNETNIDGKANKSGDTFTGVVAFEQGISVVDDLELVDGSAIRFRLREDGVFFWGNNVGTNSNVGSLTWNTNQAIVESIGSSQLVLKSNTGTILSDDNLEVSGTVTAGISGQANTIVLLGDTGEDLTITKNLNGSTRFQNTNSESFDFVGNIETSGTLKTNNYAVGGLPTAVTGERAFVNDATATTFHSIVAGGGSNFVPVFYDGTNWRIG